MRYIDIKKKTYLPSISRIDTLKWKDFKAESIRKMEEINSMIDDYKL